MKGYNKANLYEHLAWIFESDRVKSRSCVFLSHKKEDKPACRKIAAYLREAEIDYYLDEEDDGLQTASHNKDGRLITEHIKKGIKSSTHMLVVVSKKTLTSQWVPFEVGYGHASILDQNINEVERVESIKLAILTLKDISEGDLPDFMEVGYQIRGTKGLNSYISKISATSEAKLINESRMFSHTQSGHPLDDVLNWKL